LQFVVTAGERPINKGFYAIADSKEWVLGETLERAVAALQRELAAG
jgi:hypothetical protein